LQSQLVALAATSNHSISSNSTPESFNFTFLAVPTISLIRPFSNLNAHSFFELVRYPHRYLLQFHFKAFSRFGSTQAQTYPFPNDKAIGLFDDFEQNDFFKILISVGEGHLLIVRLAGPF